MDKELFKKQEEELLKIYKKLSPPQKEEVLDFIKWIWINKEKSTKKVSLKGALGDIDITEEDIEEAKKHLFTYK